MALLQTSLLHVACGFILHPIVGFGNRPQNCDSALTFDPLRFKFLSMPLRIKLELSPNFFRLKPDQKVPPDLLHWWVPFSRAGQVRKSSNPQLQTSEKSCGHADLLTLAV